MDLLKAVIFNRLELLQNRCKNKHVYVMHDKLSIFGLIFLKI